MNVMNIDQFFTGTMIIVAVALVALIACAGTWSVQFFARNRQERVAQHQPLVTYYRGLALGH